MLLLHAMLADARTLDHRGAGLASALRAAGLDPWCADLRGRRGSPATHWTYDDLVRYDVPALVGEVAAQTGRPVTLVGHSLGGHVALASVAEGLTVVHTMVLVGVNIWRPSAEPDPWTRRKKGMVMAAFHAAARVAGRFPARALRLGAADESLAYVEDFTGFWTHDRWRARDGFDWLDALPTVRVPTLAVLGAGDRLEALPASAHDLLDRLPDRTFWSVGRGSGLSVDPDHMGLLTHAGCAPWWAAAACWIRDRSPSTT